MKVKVLQGEYSAQETMDSSERSLDRFYWINMLKEKLNWLIILWNL